MTDPFHVDSAENVFHEVGSALRSSEEETPAIDIKLSKKTIRCLEILTRSSGKTIDNTIRDMLVFQSSYWLAKSANNQRPHGSHGKFGVRKWGAYRPPKEENGDKAGEGQDK